MDLHDLKADGELEFEIDVELPPDFDLPFADDRDVKDIGPLLII